MTGKTSQPFSRVHIVGTGLLGTSLGLALRERGVEVTLEDVSPSSLSLGGGLWRWSAPITGAGRA